MKHKPLCCAILAMVLLLSLGLTGCCLSIPLEKYTEGPDNAEPPTAQATQPVATTPATTPTGATEPTEAPTAAPTEAPTTAPTEAPTVPAQGNVIPLTDTIRQRINVFLSNFSEQGFDHYPADNYNLLQFGYMYCKINRSEKLGTTDSTYYVKKTDMDTFLKDFFGKTAPGQGYDGYGPYDSIIFENNAYHFPAADGECVDYLSIVSEMTKNSNGTYDVEFDIYLAEEGTQSSYYKLTAEQAAKSGKLQWCGSGSAIVRDYTRSTGKVSYQLIRYELD